jgi:hypothetical protein
MKSERVKKKISATQEKHNNKIRAKWKLGFLGGKICPVFFSAVPCPLAVVRKKVQILPPFSYR